MANYTSKYTGAQIDLSVASGSSTTGNISGSAAGTGTFGNLKSMKSSSFGTTAFSTKLVTVKGDISASGDLYLAGNDIYAGGGAGTKRLTLGASNKFVGTISASSDISSSGKLVSADEILLKDGITSGDTLIRGYASSDDGILDIYQNNSVVSRIHGNGHSYFNQSSSFGTSADSKKTLTVRGDISASGDYFSATTVNFNQSISSSKDLYLAGSDIFAGTAGTKRLTLGTKNEVFGHISASAGSGITGSRIASTDEIWLKDGALGGDTLARAYALNDDGIIDVYTNNIVSARLSGVDGSVSASGNLYGLKGVIGTTTAATSMELTVQGDISASGDLFVEDLSEVRWTGTGRGVITGSAISLYSSTGDFTFFTGSGNNTAFKIDNSENGNVGIGTGTPKKKLTVAGDISASGDIYAGDDLYLGNQRHQLNSHGGGGLTITSGSTNVLNIPMSTSPQVSIGTTTVSGKALTVSGDISSSGNFYTDGTFAKYRREVIGTKADGHNLNVSSSGAVILQSTNAATINLPAMGAALKGVQYTFVHNGTATHTWNLSPNASDKIMGSCIDSNAIATVVEGASNGAGADNKDLQLDAGSGVGDRVTIVGDGSAGWYITECMGSFVFES
jgi:hypothetical protein